MSELMPQIKPMRIGVNGRFLVAKRTGVQRAAFNFFDALFRNDRHNQYYLFTSKDAGIEEIWRYENVHIVYSPLVAGESFRNHIWEQAKLPRLAKQYELDILHCPANIAPLFYSGKMLVHIHDLCFFVNPSWYRYTFRTAYQWLIPKIVRKASKVITNSNNSKNDILEICQVDTDRIRLLYWSVDDNFLGPSSGPSSRYLNDPYILSVGSLEPRKNLERVIEAFRMLRHQHPEVQHKLVLIGAESSLFKKVKLDFADLENDIVLKGYVSDDELKRAYRDSSFLVYTSLYEGFGLPPLEAMVCGTAVLTSNSSSIPEVVSDAACCVDPFNTQAIYEAMLRLITDDTYRLALEKKGLAQVQKFSWKNATEKMRMIYLETFLERNLHLEEWEQLKKRN